ncbi:hypothetical protein [Pseudonocardia lacus]|uniref:hypothetical protein n=1 Tax=Pseudonocardia lacus TaxID=2835865 RepID=UPI001BDD1332|nr:hypothetical protein [Pseudonocardia lacus]
MTGPIPEQRPPTNGRAVLSATAAPFYPPQRCPPGVDCGPDLDVSAAQPRRAREDYDRLQLTNAESARLTTAAVDASGLLEDARPAVDAAVAAVREAEQGGVRAVDALERFVRGNRLGRARAAVDAVEERHRHDGPEDRRHRPRWARPLLWVAVPATALYDAVYFGEAFRFLIGLPETPENAADWVQYVISYLPGALIGIALMLAGFWLAEGLLRARSHVERRPERPPRRWRAVLRRRPDDLPWPVWWVALPFGALVVTVLAVFAVVRSDPAAAPTPFLFGMLLLMFTLTSIAAKVLDHNPHRSADEAARRKLAAVERDLRALEDARDAAFVALGRANDGLRGEIGRCRTLVAERMRRAWTEILHEREGHGRASDLAPAFRPLADGSWGVGYPLLFDIAEPAIALHVLDAEHACGDPGPIEERNAALMAELAWQAGSTDLPADLAGAGDPG